MAKEYTHVERVENAIACKPSDRTCYMNLDGGLIGRWYDPEFTPGDMYTRPEWAMDTIIAAGKKMGGDIAPNYMYGPIMGMDFTGIYYKTPGKELEMNSGFQAVETNPMADDSTLDFILENGVQAYIDKYVVPNWPDWALEEGKKGGMYAGIYAEKCAASGEGWYTLPIPSNGGPFFYSMSRGYMKYLKDMRKNPEKAKKITQMLAEWEVASNETMYAEMGGLTTIYPAWGRFDDQTISQEKFDEFIWPATKWLIDYAREHGQLLILHADGNFEQSLGRHIREFTPEKTIIQFDGFTNIDAVADALIQNKICAYGDVPAAMLTMGDPEDVYKRVIHLKQLLGPGLIVSSGCAAPFNARNENLDAYIEACQTSNY